MDICIAFGGGAAKWGWGGLSAGACRTGVASLCLCLSLCVCCLKILGEQDCEEESWWPRCRKMTCSWALNNIHSLYMASIYKLVLNGRTQLDENQEEWFVQPFEMLQEHPGWIAAASERYLESFWTCFCSSSLPPCVSELSWLWEWRGVDSRLWEGVGRSQSIVLYFKLSVLVWYLIQTLAAASSHMESPGSFFKVLCYTSSCVCVFMT